MILQQTKHCIEGAQHASALILGFVCQTDPLYHKTVHPLYHKSDLSQWVP
jgi:hypothetical protein